MKLHRSAGSSEPSLFTIGISIIASLLHHSSTSIARTLIAHSPGLARNIIMVPTVHFSHNPPCMGGTSKARTNFYGPKPV